VEQFNRSFRNKVLDAAYSIPSHKALELPDLGGGLQKV
jgi:hypothetical protein